MKYIVFGLGNYGTFLASKLSSLGHEVIGVDSRMEAVEQWKDQITHTICLDASNRDAVQSLPLKEMDAAIITIGENPGISIMVTALVKQLGARRVICRVISPLQQTVLESMNIHEFVYPESDSAERMAYKMDIKGVLDSYRISEEYQLMEVEAPQRYIGTAVGEINFIEEYGIKLVTLIRPVDEKNILGTIHTVRRVVETITPDIVLAKDDSLLLFGKVNKLERFVEF